MRPGDPWHHLALSALVESLPGADVGCGDG